MEKVKEESKWSKYRSDLKRKEGGMRKRKRKSGGRVPPIDNIALSEVIYGKIREYCAIAASVGNESSKSNMNRELPD
ncbi:Hypothetical protein SMAX5B_015675 [Scophthalmus maximus]|uniref:Uncharacterized protein n=1 Tax=Scophthalmus maximus TaxID=52904 RepID=A0A2U9CX85_SCOMX|nr:Hypothetical protein SMAX5B_015675 [Scophthalmus maximus]